MQDSSAKLWTYWSKNALTRDTEYCFVIIGHFVHAVSAMHWSFQVVSVYSIATEKRVKMLQIGAAIGASSVAVEDISFRYAL